MREINSMHVPIGPPVRLTRARKTYPDFRPGLRVKMD